MDQSSPLVFCGLSPRRNLISQSGSQVSVKPLCCCTKEESAASPGVDYRTDLIVSGFSVIRTWFINVLLFLLNAVFSFYFKCHNYSGTQTSFC